MMAILKLITYGSIIAGISSILLSQVSVSGEAHSRLRAIS